MEKHCVLGDVNLDRDRDWARAVAKCKICHQRGHFRRECPLECPNPRITQARSDKQGTTKTVATERQTSQGSDSTGGGW